MDFMQARVPFKISKDLKQPITPPPIASCVLATALCLAMSPSQAWNEDYRSCISMVQSNCQYTDYYLDYMPHNAGQYPDYDQCVAMGIQDDGCDSFRTSEPNDDGAQGIEEVVVIGTRDPVITAPINISPIGNPADISAPIGGPVVIQNGDSSDDREREREREDCLDDASLEHKSCERLAESTHLTQHRACESISWLGWALNAASLGRLGNVPDICGSKLEINKGLELAKCAEQYEVNKYLCKL